MTSLAHAQPSAREVSTSVYRYYDRAGMLIYVGITRQGMGRNRQHNQNAEWWQHVTSQEVEHYSTRAEAAAREKALIRRFRPPFNKQHNIGHEELREAYRAVAAVPWIHSTPIELYKRLDKRLPFEVESRDHRELVLGTRRDHFSLASRLILKKGGVPLCAHRGVGMVKEIRMSDAGVYVVCKVKQDCPPDFDMCVGYIALQPGKPPPVRLDRIVVVQDGNL